MQLKSNCSFVVVVVAAVDGGDSVDDGQREREISARGVSLHGKQTALRFCSTQIEKVPKGTPDGNIPEGEGASRRLM